MSETHCGRWVRLKMERVGKVFYDYERTQRKGKRAELINLEILVMC